MSNSFRTTALIDETATAATTNHDSSLPKRSLNASIAPLTRKSACNFNSSILLTCARFHRSADVPPAGQ